MFAILRDRGIFDIFDIIYFTAGFSFLKVYFNLKK